MTIVLVVLAALMFLFVGWLVSQSVGVQPWVASAIGEIPRGERVLRAQPDSKIGLLVLLAVLMSLFGLFMSAYVIRMDYADWRPVPEPALLWLNTGLLALGSVGMHWAYVNSGRGALMQVRSGLLFAGICIGLFILGQGLAWRQLSDAGYYATSNPANAFFYLITGLHVVHLLGGLVAWFLTTRKLWTIEDPALARLNIQICAIYFHFLLIVWFVLFSLLLGT